MVSKFTSDTWLIGKICTPTLKNSYSGLSLILIESVVYLNNEQVAFSGWTPSVADFGSYHGGMCYDKSAAHWYVPDSTVKILVPKYLDEILSVVKSNG